MKRCPACAAACWDSHRHCPSCGNDVSAALIEPGDPYAGTTLVGKYHITELIGVGAMGRVYRADHLQLDAQVAVKLLSPDVASDTQSLKRFQTEARAASRLRHPNTIQVYDFGQSDTGILFLVMELLRGRNLAQIIADEPPLSPPRMVDLLGQALSALDEAHAAGVVHRDFKPENIFVETLRTGKEHVKVLDFGIAKLRGEADANLTSRGAVCGTPDYMSPEQIRGEELDARSDVYAAGVVLYETMTGTRPFASDGPLIDVLMSHLNLQPQPPSKRRPDLTIPRALEQVCLRALDKNRENRFRSAAEMKQAMESAVRGMSGERCKQCGTPLPGTARFCPECGAVLRPTGSFATVQAAVTGPSETRTARLPLPLVGRDDVLGRLEALEREALVVVGDPGIGKTAIVEACVAREEGRFKKAVVAGADPSGAATPWYPIRRALTQLLSLSERPTREELDRASADHPQDRTGLYELFGFGGAASKLPLDVRKRECVAASLQTMRRADLTLVFEDVDRYDAPSRTILGELIMQPGTATLLATTTRPELLDVEVELVRLPPLDPMALADLLLPPGVADRSGGNPLVIVDELRALAGVKLGEAAQALLDAAVVAGGDVPTPVLAQAAGMTDVGRALAELTLHGFIRATQKSVEMPSQTLRQHIYDAMPVERRQKLHGTLASLLETRGAEPVVVAHHAYRAGETSRVALLERAADASRQGFDDDAAVRWYRAALERGRQALTEGAGDELTQIRLALKLALVLRYMGEVVASESVLREALELAVARGDRWAEVQARRGLARLAAQWDNLDGAKEHLTLALQASLAGGDAATLSELYLELAEILARLGDGATAERELWEGLMLVTAGDGPEAERGPEPLWRMLLALGELARDAGDFPGARSYGLHALRHAARVDSPVGSGRVHRFLAEVHEMLGFADHAIEHRRSAVEELRRVGDRRSTAELLIALADPEGASAVEAKAWLKEADVLAAEVGWQEGVDRSRAGLARLP
ncbi:MAG TPA: protein kinase [Polyangia bacterium]|nr:protein kinase [Polyangia bacterium]